MKSTLVIDTPENCFKCPLSYDSYGEVDICACTGAMIDNNITGKPYFCPLLPCPEKLERAETWRRDYDYLCGYREGWNRCIDYIMGEENE